MRPPTTIGPPRGHGAERVGVTQGKQLLKIKKADEVEKHNATTTNKQKRILESNHRTNTEHHADHEYPERDQRSHRNSGRDRRTQTEISICDGVPQYDDPSCRYIVHTSYISPRQAVFETMGIEKHQRKPMTSDV